jgi:hypothetical protein
MRQVKSSSSLSLSFLVHSEIFVFLVLVKARGHDSLASLLARLASLASLARLASLLARLASLASLASLHLNLLLLLLLHGIHTNTRRVTTLHVGARQVFEVLHAKHHASAAHRVSVDGHTVAASHGTGHDRSP